MKKVVIALNNIDEYFLIKEKIKNIEMVSKNVMYKEGVLELLEEYNFIDYVILNDDILGNINTENLIKKIKKIDEKISIILISESHCLKEISNYYLEKFSIEKIDKIINGEIIIKEKKIISELKKEIPTENIKTSHCIKKNKEVISVLGADNVGKSIFTVNLSNILKKNNKVLIVDLDILNNSLCTILGVKKIEKIIKKNRLLDIVKIKDLIIRIDNKIDLISGLNCIFDNGKKTNYNQFENIIQEAKEIYDYIIIDTNNLVFLENISEIIKNCTKCVFLVEPNILQIKKGKSLINFYEKKLNLDLKKINIIFNKISDFSISNSILENIFVKYKIIGQIQYNDFYNLLINSNMKYKNKEIEVEFKKIKNELFYNN